MDVKKKVYQQVFNTLLKNKTRILVTHSVDFLNRADKIVIMDQGRISATGKLSDLKQNPYIERIMSIHESNQDGLTEDATEL